MVRLPLPKLLFSRFKYDWSICQKQLSYRLCFNCVICRNSNFQCSLSSTYICLTYLLLFEREHWENFPPFFRSFEIFEILCACFVIADHQNFRERWRGWRTSISRTESISRRKTGSTLTLIWWMAKQRNAKSDAKVNCTHEGASTSSFQEIWMKPTNGGRIIVKKVDKTDVIVLKFIVKWV